MKHVYPATVHPEPKGGFSIWFDDLSGCATQGDTLPEAISMASDALAGWLYTAQKHGRQLPEPSDITSIHCEPGEFATLVMADLDAYRRMVDGRAVKKTLTIPNWLNEQAEAAHVNYSQILQQALQQHLRL